MVIFLSFLIVQAHAIDLVEHLQDDLFRVVVDAVQLFDGLRSRQGRRVGTVAEYVHSEVGVGVFCSHLRCDHVFQLLCPEESRKHLCGKFAQQAAHKGQETLRDGAHRSCKVVISEDEVVIGDQEAALGDKYQLEDECLPDLVHQERLFGEHSFRE